MDEKSDEIVADNFDENISDYNKKNFEEKKNIAIKVKKQFTCDICAYSCAEKGNLKKHVISVHEEIKPFTCKICGYDSSQKSVLKRHFESVHEKVKPFKCGICDLDLQII